MKACSAALAAHLAGDSTTLAYLWKLTPAAAAPPAAPVTVFSDDFNRADGPIGSNWVLYNGSRVAGTVAISSDQLTATEAFSPPAAQSENYVTYVNPLPVDQWVQVTNETSGSNSSVSLLIRRDGTTGGDLSTPGLTGNAWVWECDPGYTSWQAYDECGGYLVTDTSPGASPLPHALVPGDVMFFGAQGSTFVMQLNGVTVYEGPMLVSISGFPPNPILPSYDDPGCGAVDPNNLHPGMYFTLYNATVDNFSCGTWASAPPPSNPLGFTTHDQDLLYPPGSSAVTYQAETGMTNTASKGSNDLSSDNLEVTAFLESASITESDILAGKYDNADVEVRLVNWADLTMGDVLLRKGTVGVVKMKNGVFTAELMGLAHKLAAQIGSSYGPICRATFGSGLNGIDMTSHYKCYFDVTTIRQNATVAAVLDHHTLTPSPLSPPPGAGAAPSSTGAMFPGTVAQAHRENDWSNPGNVTAADGNYATATLYGSSSQVNEASLLQATNFGFTVPSDAVIVGVLATVQRQQFSGTSAVYDDTVTLLGAAGSDRRNASPWSPGPAPSGEIAVNYGSPSDTWGAALTPAIVNAAAFGIQIGCECTQLPGSGADIGIDSITMTVFYTGAGGGPSAGWFDDGFMTFTSGILNGASFEIKTWDGQNVHLFLPMPVLPAAGDAFWIEPGCNKTTDCQAKYNNIVNFRGEPFIPGMDQLLDYASS